MFTLAQPHYGYYNPYEELAMQQELQRRRQIEAYLRRQREAEAAERRRQAYEAAVRAEYERRREAEFEYRRQAELQRRRQAQQARGRYSMHDGGLESLFDALYGGQRPSWEEPRPAFSARNSPPPARDPTPSPAPVSTPTPAPAQVSVAVVPEQEPEEEPRVDTAPSFAAVQSILASFTTLKSEFTFPTQPDFLPDSSKLAYTPNNAPIHGYEHALTGLLTRLDAVESYGDEGVRKARKEAVKTIEKELERLDGMKLEAWNRANEPQTEANLEEATATEVDPLTVPLPEDEETGDEAMEEVEDALEAVPGEPTVADQPNSNDHAEPATVSNDESATSLERSTDTDTSPALILPSADTNLALHDNSTLDASSTQPSGTGPLVQLLTPPTPSEASGGDSNIELEEYVDVERISSSEDEHTEPEVEKDGDLELIRDWDLDF